MTHKLHGMLRPVEIPYRGRSARMIVSQERLGHQQLLAAGNVQNVLLE